jgi:hypothetical protein
MLGLLFAAMRSRIAWVAISAELLRHCAHKDACIARSSGEVNGRHDSCLSLTLGVTLGALW